MQNDWIIDVLADLNSFALTNGMPKLAEQLESAALVASVELASAFGGSEVGDTGTTTQLYIPETGRGVGT